METRIPTGIMPLYHQYPGQCNPQDAFVELDLDQQVLQADWNAAIGNAVPMDVWHGITRRWPARINMTQNEVSELLEALAPLAERVIAGYGKSFDYQNNPIPVFIEDAGHALNEISAICERWAESPGEMEICDDIDSWFWNARENLIDAIKTRSVKEIAEELYQESLSDNVYCPLLDIEGMLEYWKQEITMNANEFINQYLELNVHEGKYFWTPKGSKSTLTSQDFDKVFDALVAAKHDINVMIRDGIALDGSILPSGRLEWTP